VEESVTRVAARIKRWRGEAGLSLQELANRSDVSPSTIHKIEHCQTVPTIAVVLKLAAGLGRHATELFDDSTEASQAMLTRCDDRQRLASNCGARIEALTAEHGARELGFWRVVHPAGFRFGGDALGQLSGEIVLMVEDGELHVTVGDEHFDLRSGDTLHWKASSPSAWENKGQVTATALLMGSSIDSLRPALVSSMRRFSGEAEPPSIGLATPIAARA
jgi:transcriptional regulator with XRE-family HTH domain